MDFIDGKVSRSRAIALLARNGVEVNDEEAAVILSFLYLMAKIHSRKVYLVGSQIPMEKSNKSNSCPA